jgi:hypothetical protein
MVFWMIDDEGSLCERLLTEAKANIDGTENMNLYTALHLMIKEEKWDSVIWLIEVCCDRVRDTRQMTSLCVCVTARC